MNVRVHYRLAGDLTAVHADVQRVFNRLLHPPDDEGWGGTLITPAVRRSARTYPTNSYRHVIPHVTRVSHPLVTRRVCPVLLKANGGSPIAGAVSASG
jgi:hypothetical protein